MDEKTQAAGGSRLNTQTALLSIIVVVLVTSVLYLAKAVVLPLIFAYLLSYLVSPILRGLERLKVPRALGVFLVVLLLLAAALLFSGFLFQRVGAFAEQFPKYHAKFMEISDSLTASLNLKDLAWRDIDWTKTFGKRLVAFAGSAASFMSNTLLVLIFLVFMLLEQGHLSAKLLKALSEKRARKITKAMGDITGQIRRYLQIKILVSLITGVLVWLVLTVLRVDFAATWGMLAFFLNFIPNIGSIVASLPPIFVVFVANYPSPLPVVLTAVALLLIQITMGNIVEPKIQGQGLNLSPLVILFSLVFWGWLWGIPGMLLSVPIASSIKIICGNIEHLKPVSILMGGLPHSKPEDSST